MSVFDFGASILSHEGRGGALGILQLTACFFFFFFYSRGVYVFDIFGVGSSLFERLRTPFGFPHLLLIVGRCFHPPLAEGIGGEGGGEVFTSPSRSKEVGDGL